MDAPTPDGAGQAVVSYLGESFPVLKNRLVSLESGVTILQPGLSIRVGQGHRPMVVSKDSQAYFEETRNNLFLGLAIGYDVGPKGLQEIIQGDPQNRERLLNFRYQSVSPLFCVVEKHWISDEVKECLGYVLDYDDRLVASLACPRGFVGIPGGDGGLKDLVKQALAHDVDVGVTFHNNALGVLGEAVYMRAEKKMDRFLFDGFDVWFKEEKWPKMKGDIEAVLSKMNLPSRIRPGRFN